jgi:predicted amidohydrolase YtcJ
MTHLIALHYAKPMTIDLVLHNGVIHTLATPRPVAAVAVSRGAIVALGSDQDVREMAGATTKVIDLGGRCVVPGLIDAHVHLSWFGLSLLRVRLDGATSLSECLQRVAQTLAAGLQPGQWLLGSGWNHNDWTEARFPDRLALDSVAPANPVILTRKDGHSIWVNTRALSMAGVSAASADPAGGTIDRDPATGEPTGILRENAMDLIERIVPDPGPAELEQALLLAQEQALAAGLSGVHTMEGPDVFAALQRLDAEGKLVLRVCQAIAKDHLDEAIGLGVRSGFGNDRLRIGGVKLFADGSLGSATAALLADYAGAPGQRGVITLPKDEMRTLVRKASAAGIAPVIHAIGDRANRDVLDVFEETITAGVSPRLRFRIEHVQLLHPDDIGRFARLGVVASMQPTHCTSDRYMAMRLWGERSRHAYAWRSLLQSGAALAFGSDCPVETISPLAGIHAAATRQRADEPDSPPWYPEERLSTAQALHAFTQGAAYAAGEEHSKGSLAPGKLADMTVLSKDILAIPAQDILSCAVDMTVVGGQIAFSRF